MIYVVVFLAASFYVYGFLCVELSLKAMPTVVAASTHISSYFSYDDGLMGAQPTIQKTKKKKRANQFPHSNLFRAYRV